MKIGVDPYCINASDLDRSVHFYETVPDPDGDLVERLETHGESPEVSGLEA